MRVLFLTTLLPGLRRTGGEVATQRFADAIRDAGHELTLLAYRRVGTAPPLSRGDLAVADRHIETRTAGARPVGWMLRALLTGRPYSVAKFTGRAYTRAMEAAFERARPDVVVLDHAQMGWLVPRGGWEVPMVYLAHNVEHTLHAALSRSGGPRAWAHRRESRRIAAVERMILGHAGAVWTLTRDDAEVLRSLAPEVPSRTFDTPPVTIPDPPGEATRDVVILGSWHWKPNAAGLKWFADDVAPHLARHGVEVVVGGAHGPDVIGATPGVRAVGPVPDALEFLQSGRIVAIPSVAGGGVQIKTLDAIASGRRVVATATAMRGIDMPPPTVREIDEPQEFAAEVVRGLEAGDDAAASATARTWAVERTARFEAAVREGLEEAVASRP